MRLMVARGARWLGRASSAPGCDVRFDAMEGDRMARSVRLFGMVVGALSVLGATAVGIARSAWNRTTARAVEQLRESARVDRDAVAPAFSQALVEGLPEPVKHYLTFALDEGQ